MFPYKSYQLQAKYQYCRDKEITITKSRQLNVEGFLKELSVSMQYFNKFFFPFR